MLSGAFLGFWLAISYEFILRSKVVKHINDLTNRKKTTKMWKLITFSIIAYIVTAGISFAVFYIDLEIGTWRIDDSLTPQGVGPENNFEITVWKTWG